METFFNELLYQIINERKLGKKWNKKVIGKTNEDKLIQVENRKSKKKKNIGHWKIQPSTLHAIIIID
jgi:hypothetical protein